MTIVKTKDILALLNEFAPFDLSEDWDNCGLQVGRLDAEVRKIIISLDVSLPVLDVAVKDHCDLVLTHHPLFMSPQKKIAFDRMPGKAIETAAKHGINIISIHTNMDKANEGLNDYFASVIGLKDIAPLSIGLLQNLNQTHMGFGRIGYLHSSQSLKPFAKQIKERLNLGFLRITGDLDILVNAVAVCTGSGGSLIEEFIKSEANVFITGDLKYHEARRVEEESKAVIDVGHFSSEQMVVDLIYHKLTAAFEKLGYHIEIVTYKRDKDPFTIL